jgi:hypothetical protein
MDKSVSDLDELIDLVHQAIYEIDELRACYEHEFEEEEMDLPFLDQLELILKQLYEDMVAGRYLGPGLHEDLPYTPIVQRWERRIPFRELLHRINHTHRHGFRR